VISGSGQQDDVGTLADAHSRELLDNLAGSYTMPASEVRMQMPRERAGTDSGGDVELF
jgi:hypothetical protein